MSKVGKISSAVVLDGEREYRQACKDISDNLRLMGSEMKLVTAEYGKNNDSVEGLTAKQDVLKKMLEEQAKAAEAAEKQLALLRSEGIEPTDPAYKKMETSLNNAKAAMVTTEKEIEGIDRALQDNGETLEKAKTDWSGLGDVVKGAGAAIGAAMAAVGAAAASAGKFLFDMGMEAAGAGDRVDKASQRLGMSSQAFQEWDYIIAQNGGNIDSLGAGMKTLQKTMDGLTEDGDKSSEAFKKIGINFDEIKDKSPEDAFDMTVKALQKMPPGAEKTAAAMKLLGKQGMELMPLLNQTAEGTEELRKRSHDLGMVMSDEAINAAVVFGDTLDDLKRSFAGVKNSIGAELLPGFTQITEGLIGLVNGQNDAGEKLKDGVGEVVGAIAEAIPQVLEVVLSATTAIGEAAPAIVMALIDGIVGNLPMLIESALTIVTALVEGLITAMPALLDGAMQLIQGLAGGIADALPVLVPVAVTVLTSLIGTLIDNIPLLIDAALKLLTGLTQGVIAALPVLIAEAPKIITSLVNALLGSISLIINCGIELLTALIDALPEIIDAIVLAIPEIVVGIVEALMGNIDKIILAGVELLTALVTNIPQITMEIVKAIPQIITGIIDAILGAVPKLSEVGGNLMKGLGDGISKAAKGVIDNVKGFGNSIVSGLKNVLGIASPSKVSKAMGVNFGESFILGLDGMGRKIDRTMRDVFSVPQLAGPEFAGGYAQPAYAHAGGGSVDVTLNVDGRRMSQRLGLRQADSNQAYARARGVIRRNNGQLTMDS